MANLSKAMAMAQDGVLMECYTKNGWFVKVKPAYQIEKVKVSFVKMNTKGSGFDVYVDLYKFELLADDILSGKLAELIATDRQLQTEAQKSGKTAYPNAWTYTTGNNGEKSVTIGAGRADVVIQGGNKTEKQFAPVPCTYDDLRIMAKNFRRTVALKLADLAKTTLEASEKYNHETVNDDDEETKPETPEEGTVANEAEEEETANEIFRVKVTGNFTDLKGKGYAANATLEDGRKVSLMLWKPAIKEVEKRMPIGDFVTKMVGQTFSVVGKISEYQGREQLVVSEFPAKAS